MRSNNGFQCSVSMIAKNMLEQWVKLLRNNGIQKLELKHADGRTDGRRDMTSPRCSPLTPEREENLIMETTKIGLQCCSIFMRIRI
jgi:hypothetical protein